MGIEGIKVIGGALNQKALSSKLDEKTYEIVKSQAWLVMLKDKMVPVRWLRPTKQGTKIRFIYPQSQKEWDQSLEDLKVFIDSINRKHGTDLYISAD